MGPPAVEVNASSSYIEYVTEENSSPWDIEVDVLVIGAGGCGLVAALAAAQAGAQVLVVEKEGNAGGNTSLSQAMVPAAGTAMQKKAGVDDTPELMAADILRKNAKGSDPSLTLHVAQESAPFIEWLKDDHGIELSLVDDFLYPGHSVLRIHANPTRKGKNLVQQLLNACARFDNIDIAYNAPATHLVARQSDRAVLGAVVEIEGIGQNRARAHQTILALNGFGANRDMLQTYIPEMAGAYYFGHEGNTGEGIKWGAALGAELDCMGAYQAHGSVAAPHGTLLTWAAISLGGYQVNLQGKRFVNEYHGYSEHALDVLGQPEGVAVEIFDGRIHDIILSYEDFQQCMEVGAVKPFDTIEDLARGFRIPAKTLAHTHETFQACARNEIQDSLGRKDFGPALKPPLYGVKVTGALFHTQGGLKIDSQARVLRPDGTPIPSLYAGGGTAAGFSGKSGPSGYLSANGLMAALILGRLAGTHSAQAIKA